MSLHKGIYKIGFYLRRCHILAHRRAFFGRGLRQAIDVFSKMSPGEQEDFLRRIFYYCKQSRSFSPSENAISVQDLGDLKSRTQRSDLENVFRFFPDELMADFIIGDNTIVPTNPVICKSRPCDVENDHAILLKINEIRHYYWRRDPVPFDKKKPIAVWRGACYQPLRKRFVDSVQGRDFIDAQDSRPGVMGESGNKGFLPVKDQMAYRYIISLEGNDVATNLKWIMRSNSLCLMPKPKYETWFMEGSLNPGQHYVEIKNDFSDIEEKIEYFERNPSEAKSIINAANRYTKKFYRHDRELALQLLVALRYFFLSGQLYSSCAYSDRILMQLEQLPDEISSAICAR